MVRTWVADERRARDMEQKGVLATVQALRALAAVIVAIGHAFIELPKLAGYDGGEALSFNHGFGVDIFFVISGFIMVYTSRSRFGVPGAGRSFLLARFLRIAPIYWTMTLLLLLAAYAFPTTVSAASLDAPHILASLFFVPLLNENGDLLPLLTIGWTLNYEMFFYLLFALALLLPRSTGMMSLFATFGALALAGIFVSQDMPQIWFWTRSIILEFAFGVAIGLLAARLGRTAPALLLLSMAAGAIGFLLGHWLPHQLLPRFLALGLPATALVAGAVGLDLQGRSISPPLIAALGEASYSLYLSHMFVIRLLRVLWNRLALAPDAVLFCAAAIVLSCLVALALARAVELPLHDYCRRRIKGRLGSDGLSAKGAAG